MSTTGPNPIGSPAGLTGPHPLGTPDVRARIRSHGELGKVVFARFEHLAETGEDWTAADVLLGVLWDINASLNDGLSPIARRDRPMPSHEAIGWLELREDGTYGVMDPPALVGGSGEPQPPGAADEAAYVHLTLPTGQRVVLWVSPAVEIG